MFEIILYKTLTFNSESQVPTQIYGRRPFGVGLLVAGYDVCKSKILSTCIYIYFKCLYVWIHILLTKGWFTMCDVTCQSQAFVTELSF